MASLNDFPFEFRSDENEIKELQKYFLGKSFEHVYVGPKNYTMLREYTKDAANIYNLPLRSDDIFVASFPRSGTTWTQELVWLLANDMDYVKAAAEPLTSRYTFIEFPMFMNKDSVSELKSINADNEERKKIIDYLSRPGSEVIAEKPSPRFIKTHLPMTLLPPHILDIAKVVYVARDPRDAAVSFFHQNRLFKMAHFVGDFKTYWNFFVRNMILWTPFFDHLKEAWELRNHPNLLFLFYEDL
ncbi:unnamed protein product [Parnassius mnemosyne]|uniref:Sulfotransferase domain-containing protein n=1 Tax=Parnassius mnemosyne TaxID=213953 RepID=A0AAV1KIJ5_9NEOP